MHFFQHVYARVSKGVHDSFPGYQLAAVSDGIAGDADLIGRLNRFSFLDYGGGKGTAVRYGFFRFKDAYVAFGASRFARDLSGSIGAFTHNLVLRREEFLDREFSPVDVFASFPFLKSESELSERRLPEVDFETTGHSFSEKWKPLAFSLVDTILGESTPVVPMVILPEQDMWDLLALVFHMLPRVEASRLSFSSLFVNAIDFIDGFKLVFIPDKSVVPSGTQIFRIIDPAGNIRRTEQVPLRSLWERHWDRGESFLRLAHVLRHHPERKDEVLPLLSPLASIGPDFRLSVEQLKLPALYEALFLKAEWIVPYWRAGAGLAYGVVADMIWKDPAVYMKPLLTALGELGAEDLITNIMRDLNSKLLHETLPLTVLESVEAAGQMGRFIESLSVGDASISIACGIASRLRIKDPMDLRVHKKAAVYILELIRSSGRRNLERLLPWLSEESKYTASHSFFEAVADCAAWILDPKNISWRAERYDLAQEEYLGLLSAIWTPIKKNALGVSGGDWVSMVFHPEFADSFLKSLARNLEDLDFRFQKEVLGAVFSLIKPMELADGYIMRFIENSEKPERLARFYLELLNSRKTKAYETIKRLEDMVGNKKWFA
jgi:hypothetical protein